MALFWKVKTFDQLNSMDVYSMLHLRESVFILEQDCLYQDIDFKDLKCTHLLGWQEESEENLAAYARILPPGVTFEEPGIGRVVTAPPFRGLSLGRELMREAIRVAQILYAGQPIRISAQAHLQRFYGEFGFQAEGSIYDEDGIPHMAMVLQP